MINKDPDVVLFLLLLVLVFVAGVLIFWYKLLQNLKKNSLRLPAVVQGRTIHAGDACCHCKRRVLEVEFLESPDLADGERYVPAIQPYNLVCSGCGSRYRGIY